MPRSRRATLIVSLTPLILAILMTAAWAVDHSRLNGKVTRNVEVAGLDIGELDRSDAEAKLATLADTFPSTPVTIVAGDIRLEGTAEEFGIYVDVDATLNEAMGEGQEGFSPVEVVRWMGSLTDRRPVAMKVAVDDQKLEEAILRLEGPQRTDPVEPSVSLGPAGATFVAGSVGQKTDVASVEAAIPTELSGIGNPITIQAERLTTKPKLSDAPFAAFKKRVDSLLAEAVELKAGGDTETLTRDQLIGLLSIKDAKTKPTLVVDQKKVGELIAALFPMDSNVTGVRFDMQGGALVPVPGKDATVCCAAKATEVAATALGKGSHSIELPMRTMTAAEGVEWAKGLGVKEPISTFTTNHPCCAARVTNIHRISDLTRGTLIPPGGTYSVNDAVGPRTAEKGFVSAGVIEDGEFKDDFGGGVSQFATTFFNAAFFAGLDIPDYKAHSVYISRYPFGREATLAYPHVDLVIHNNTPYGIVMWPTYTDSSVTMTLYSSRYASAQVVSGPTATQTSDKAPRGCGTVTTVRETTIIPTGAKSRDTFRAYYTCEPPEHN